MQSRKYFYLVKIQYLGYRLHGWQRQPGLKTVEGLIKKTLKFVLGEARFKILGSSRTDAMVSAKETAFELFLYDHPLGNLEEFLEVFNKNLPPDIRAMDVREVDASFNIIQHPRQKEYLYFFAFGTKSHPFAAPLLATFVEPLNIERMREGAKCFEGYNHFHNYCTKPSPKMVTKRKIDLCRIELNDEITASFFPDKTFFLRVRGAGFLRNQIRLMMGNLVLLGRGEITLSDIEQSLLPEVIKPANYIAPGSGLILHKLDFPEQL